MSRRQRTHTFLLHLDEEGKNIKAFATYCERFQDTEMRGLLGVSYIQAQEEIGDGEDRNHLQGTVQFMLQKSVKGAKDWLQKSGINGFMVQEAENLEAAIRYSQKEETRVVDGISFKYGHASTGGRKRKCDDDRYEKAREMIAKNDADLADIEEEYGTAFAIDFPYKKIKRLVELERIKKRKIERKSSSLLWFQHNLLPWQKSLSANLKKSLQSEKRDRLVHVIYDPDGSAGKNTFAEKYCEMHPTKAVHVKGGKAADVAFVLKSKVRRTTEVVFINYARTDNAKFISVSIAEDLKDKKITSTKYECTELEFDEPPLVVMMVNHLPDLGKLSMDRWKIMQLEGKAGQPKKFYWLSRQQVERLKAEADRELKRSNDAKKAREDF